MYYVVYICLFWLFLHLSACIASACPAETTRQCIESKHSVEWLKSHVSFWSVAVQYGRAAIHQAASEGHDKVIRSLVEHGADANAKDEDGETALMKAARNGKIRVSLS